MRPVIFKAVDKGCTDTSRVQTGPGRASWLPEPPRSLAPGDLVDFLAQFRENRALRRLLILVNLGGVAYGFYYYGRQFDVTPIHLWAFVPDSPLSVGLIALVFALDEFGVRSRILEAIAFIDLIKVGAWTGYVLLHYDAAFEIWRDPLSNLNFYLFWLHLGMVIEAFVLAKWLVPLGRGFVLVVGAFAAELYMDYAFTGFAYGGCTGTRPITVPCADNGLLAGVTVALTVAGLFAFAILSGRNRRLTASTAS